jgi:type I restriction enzyme, S subunit
VSEGTQEKSRWPIRRLGDVLVRHNEVVHPGQRTGEATFVGLEHIEPNSGRRIGSLPIDLGALTGRKPTFRRGQIVYGYLRPYLNKVWVAEFDGYSSVDQFAFDVLPELADTDFIASFMRSETFLRRSSIVTTTGQLPRIGTEQIAAVPIELPPLDIQRRIVAGLNEQLDVAAAARRAAEDRLAAAKALVPACIRSVFESIGPDGPVVALGDVCDVQLGKMLSPKSKTGVRPIPYLRNENVQWNRFDLADVAWMDFSTSEEEKFRLVPGDLLVCEGGEPGRSAIWSGEIERCCYQKALHRIRPRDHRLYPPFLMYRLWMAAAEAEFVDAHSKTTIAHLPMEKLVRVRFALPTIEVQRHAAETLASLLTESENVHRLVDEQAASVTAIPDALLRATFNRES